jgi:hypothetical protein
MGYQDIDLAKIRLDEARKKGLESQRVYREMHVNSSVRRESQKAFLRAKILSVRCFILQFGERIYCRTLDFFYSRPA